MRRPPAKTGRFLASPTDNRASVRDCSKAKDIPQDSAVRTGWRVRASIPLQKSKRGYPLPQMRQTDRRRNGYSPQIGVPIHGTGFPRALLDVKQNGQIFAGSVLVFKDHQFSLSGSGVPVDSVHGFQPGVFPHAGNIKRIGQSCRRTTVSPFRY